MASREAYQVPSTSGGAYTGAGATSAARDPGQNEGAGISYICSDCATKMSLKKNDFIRCKECGGRVLYKERTKRMVQFEAR